jgi:hypothetical protein
MIEVKNNFNGGLNLDDSPYTLPNNAYVYGLNVTRDAIEGSNDRALTNIVGNQLVSYAFPFDNIITVSSNVETLDGTTFVTLTFNGSNFIPPGWNVRLLVGDIPSGETAIAEYTTVSTITINQLLLNLSNTFYIPDIEFVSITNNQIVFSYLEDYYDIPDNWAVFSYYGFIGSDNYKCIGVYPDVFRNTVIYFVWAGSGYHLVLEYDNETRTISHIFRNLIDSNNLDILGFTENDKINNINVYHRNVDEGEGDILFFLDSLGRPTVMDILRFKNGEYTPVTRDIIDVAKRPPLLPPQCLYGNDATKNVNSLKDKLFRFKYRYIYDNYEKSTCSPISSVPLPIQILDKDYTNVLSNNNLITITLNSGDKDVKYVELLMSYVNKTNDWSDFESVDIIDKTSLNLRYTYTVSPSNNPEELPSVLEITFDTTQSIGAGTVLNVYFYYIPTGERILASTYTTVLGDTVTQIISNLISNLISSPYGLSANTVGGHPDQIDFGFNPDWSFDQIEVINNTDLLSFRYSFYNDASYPVIDINESIQLFDYVPDKANAQEMPNGNVLLYGGITEGYNRNLTPNVVNTVLTKPSGSSSVGQLTTNWSWNKSLRLVGEGSSSFLLPVTNNFISFRGIPLYDYSSDTGTVVNYYLHDPASLSPVLKGTYTTQPGDTYIEVAQGLIASILTYGDPNLLEALNYIPGEIFLKYKGEVTDPNFGLYVDHITISEPVTTQNVFPTFLYSTQRKLGIAYFDNKGKTNGILYSGQLQFPEYDENEDNEMLLPYINTKIYHTPPEWAYSYGFYLTKENTQFLYWESTRLKVDDEDKYYFFDVSNIAITQSKFPTKSSVLSWTFQDGDRLRVIKKVDDTTPIVYSGLEVPIEGIVNIPTGGTIPEGTYVKVPKTTALSGAINSLIGDTKFIIQLFRNNQKSANDKNEVYYEFGQQYLIGNPTLPSRYHIGMVQDQGVPATLSNTFTSNSNTINIKFSGTVLTGTRVIIHNSAPIASVDPLASYTSLAGYGIEQIVDALIAELSAYVGTLFINVIKVSTTEIEIRISATPSSPVEIITSDIQIISPTTESIPAEFNFYDGDVYYTSRIIYLSPDVTESYNCLDRNFLDNYNSAVNSIDGRSSVIDINARRAYYSAMVRFSNAYQPNTNINATNRFYPNNFDEYDYSFGDIMRFRVRDRFVRVFQKLKVGQVPLYNQILKEQNKESLVVTDRLLNPIQYYMGDVGIGDNPESLASYNFADYFTSNIKGVICRVSNDGVKFLSIDCKVDSWAWKAISQRFGNYKIYGAFDQILQQYIIAMEATPNDPAYTLMYNEGENTFDTFLSYEPEMMTSLGVLFITFKNGELWTHDNEYYNRFYGSNYPSQVTMLFNQSPLDRKTFLSLSQISSELWVCDNIETDIVMYGNNQQSSLIESDFENLEGSYEAAILGDIHSPGGIATGDSMKGKYMRIKFNKFPANTLVSLNLLSLKYINSPLNNR